MNIRLIIFTTSLFLMPKVWAQEPDFLLIGPTSQALQHPIPDVLKMAYSPSPSDAIAYAVIDIATVPEADQPFQRYVWIPDGDKQKIAVISYAVNLAISKASTLVSPATMADGRLVRWDMRSLAPQDNEYTILNILWEDLAFEPYFHITNTTAVSMPTNSVQVESLADDPPKSLRFKVGDELFYKSPNDEFFNLVNNKWESMKPKTEAQKIAVYGAHTGLEQSVLLQGMTKSNAAIVRYDFFLFKILSTIDGGMYYRFAGIEPKPAKGTALEAFLQSLGTSRELVEQLRSDQRAAMFRSNVTGKPRRIDVFYGVNVRPSSGVGLITMTHDMGDDDVDHHSDPIRNLLSLKSQSHEVIATKSNGMHIFALFDSNGELRNEVPSNIARDHMIPSPYTARLQAAIGCIRCHGSDEGLKPFKNEVQTMLSGLMDIFEDESSKDSIPNQLDRLAGLYAGDLDKPLRRGRDDYNDAVFLATGGMSVSQVSSKLSDIYGDYVYREIGAFEACYELGYLVSQDEADYCLNQILPPLQLNVNGIGPEDPIIGALKSGLKINRYQWEQVYPDVALRAFQTRKTQEISN